MRTLIFDSKTDCLHFSGTLQKALIAFALIGLFIALSIISLSPIRKLIITLTEQIIMHRTLNFEKWNYVLLNSTSNVAFVFIYLLVAFFNKGNSKIFCLISITLLIVNASHYYLVPSGVSLDNSDQWAINYLAHSKQYMKNITITVGGPLWYLTAPHQYVDTNIQSLLFYNCILLLFLSVFYLLYKENIFSASRLRLVLFTMFPFIGTQALPDITYFSLVLACWYLRDKSRWFTVLTISIGIIASLFLFIKFNMAMQAGLLAFILGLFLIHCDRKSAIKYLLCFSISYLLVASVCIFLFYNSLADFAQWFKYLLITSGAYSSSMNYPTSRTSLFFLLVAFIIIALYLFMSFNSLKYSVLSFVIYTLGFIVLFFSFKHGFVRQDRHMDDLFSTVPVLFGICILFSPKMLLKKNYICTVLVLSLCGIYYLNNRIDFSPKVATNKSNISFMIDNFKRFNDTKGQILESSILSSEFNNTIASHSIKIIPWELSYANANNWQGWKPNAISILPSVYTKSIDEFNSSDFNDNIAPDFILVEYKTIDSRNMFLDAPATWNKILPNYSIEKEDDSRLLLKRKTDYKSLRFISLGKHTFTFDEIIDVPVSTTPVFAKINIKQTFTGKLVTTLFRGNPSFMTAIFSDGSEKEFRIIENVLQSPTMISFLPNDFEEMKEFFLTLECEQFAVKKIKITNTARSIYFGKNIEIEWLTEKR